MAQTKMDQFHREEEGETTDGEAVDIPDEDLLLVAEHGSGKMERLAALQLYAKKRGKTVTDLMEERAG